MIPVQNIYYMLTYAYRVLSNSTYKNVETEAFENAAELYTAILILGIGSQLKRGLNRDYIETVEAFSMLRGKIELNESIRPRMRLKQQLLCCHDEFSLNTRMNRILKTMCDKLLKTEISRNPKRDKIFKQKLRYLLVYFEGVDNIDLSAVDWRMQFHRNNETYRMLMGICQLLSKSLLQTRSDGCTNLMDFEDDQSMSHLYEKFLLEYYCQEHPELKASASRIEWQLDEGSEEFGLPEMRSDIMLAHGQTVLIIDAKYYTHNMQENYGKRSVHSGNLYQIFTYVKNKEAELENVPHRVVGMLLYAKTDDEIQPNATYHMSGNEISVRTLDLNCPFGVIKHELDAIAETYFPDHPGIK